MKKTLSRLIFVLFAFGSVFGYTRHKFPSFYYNADMQMGKSLYVLEDILLGGNLRHSDGSLVHAHMGVYAYMSNHGVTITTGSDTYYPVNGIFVNDPIGGFVTSGASIVYTGEDSYFFEIQYNSTFESDTNNTTMQSAIKINGIVATGSTSKQKIGNATFTAQLSATYVISLNSGDQIQLVIKSDQAGANLTANSFSTSLQPFY